MGTPAFRSLGYLTEDESFLINEKLTHIEPIEIPLPKAPAYDKITGYGLKPEEQFFHYEEYPETLRRMERDLRKTKKEENPKEPFLTLEDIRAHITQNSAKYAKEIKWIKSQWYYRLHGKWFFIKGKPHYISAWHWMFLNYYTMKDTKVSRPEYRDRDRRWYIACEYFFNEQIDENGEDLGRYCHLGINDIENRRQGKTSRVASVHLDYATRTLDFNGGIQGKDSKNSGMVFSNHVVFPFRKYPWFFSPLMSGSTDPAKSLSFKPQSIRHGGKGTVVSDKEGLESEVDWATTAEESHYDGEKKTFIHIDETAKLKRDVFSRHLVLRECVAQGAGLNRTGFMFNTTTVEETESDKQAGIDIMYSIQRFKILCDGSHYDRREGGSTETGLVNIFMPAHDGLEGCIDPWGFSEKEKALERIFSQRKKFEKLGHMSALAKYIRKFPVDYPEIFTPNAEDVYFDRTILTNRIKELQFKVNELIVNGNFERIDPGNLDSPVVFRAAQGGSGRFNLSLVNLEKYGYGSNEYYMKNGQRYPKNPRFIACGDPFKNNKTKSRGSRISKGGGAVFWLQDPDIDPNTKEVMDWESNRFVCTYQHRPGGTSNMSPKDEYCEDMIMMMEYFGALMYPERNVQDLIDYIEDRGRAGYFLYTIKQTKFGKQVEDLPGFDTVADKIKDELFKGLASHIRLHGMREKHIEILQDCMSINGISDMTNYDRLTAAMGCLKGAKSHYVKIYHQKHNSQKRFTMASVYGGNRYN